MYPEIKITPDQEAILKAQYKHLNNRDLGNLLGVSPSTVQKWMKRFNLDRGYKIIKTEPKQEYYFDWGRAAQTDFIINNC